MKRLIITTALALAPAVAFAQTTPPQGSSGMVIERLENRFVVAPDVKITEIDGDTGGLVGGYAGWLAEDTLLVGGAAYFLADGPNNAELFYGGLLIGWSTPPEHRIQFGARGLVGFGHGQLDTELARAAFDGHGGRGFGDGFARFGSRPGPVTPLPTTTVRIRAEDDFFVFEPQITLVTKLTSKLALTWAGGYRLTGYTDVLDDRLKGVTGSIALQWNGW